MATFEFKQISSLEKVRIADKPDFKEISAKTLLRGERFNYQLPLFGDRMLEFRISVESNCADWVKLYAVQNAVMDMPMYMSDAEEDYITREPGLMPDILLPLQEQNYVVQTMKNRTNTVWVRIDVPEDAKPGTYTVTVKATRITEEEMKSRGVDEAMKEETSKTMTLEVLPVTLPAQKLIFTQWFYADCIAVAHNVDIYSEKHWELIDKYMAMAADSGMNMLLLPVITPPLDTMYGVRRPCVQLVGIEKKGDTYSFDFTKLHRWIEMGKKNGMRYFEMCHMFSQWGMRCAPNILVKEDGQESYLFGWHVAADAPEYEAFLKQFLPAVVKELEKAGVADHTYYHISDEPKEENLETYERFSKLIKSLIGNGKRMDALSHFEFYEKGLVDVPVTTNSRIGPFLEKKLPEQWVYYCMSQRAKVSNRFLAMPAYRNRIMGLQMYRTNVKGFLHWALNYYYSRCSTYPINPYVTTSSDLTFPSGDAFSVYPGQDGPVLSMRALVLYDGLQDMRVCSLLESYIGREAVEKLIDTEAGMALTYEEYPRNADYILDLRQKMTELIRQHLI